METFFLVPVFERYSKWLLFEIFNAYELIGNKLILSNIEDERLAGELRRRGVLAFREDFTKVLKELPKPIIVLDPKAKRNLDPGEASSGTVVIGGILGTHPPSGRTSVLVSSRFQGFKEFVYFRKIGDKQFTIDGALAVAWLISQGRKLEEIEVVNGLKITQKLPFGLQREIELPYAYPKIDGKVFISNELLNYLLTS